MKVFVYGSLRRGGEFHSLMASADLVGTWTTPAAWSMWLCDGYPAIVAGGTTAIVGEVYAIDAPALARLDELEEHPDWYTRQPIETPFGTAWVYVFAAPPVGARPIPSGDWFAR